MTWSCTNCGETDLFDPPREAREAGDGDGAVCYDCR